MIENNWLELIKPNNIDVATKLDPNRFGTITVDPLERGYGLTLGNALRRVLLSSLQGAAVTSIKVNGAGNFLEVKITKALSGNCSNFSCISNH